MSEFIKLTGGGGPSVSIRTSTIIAFVYDTDQNVTVIEAAGLRDPLYVRETPEEISAIISGDGDMFTDPEVDDLRLDLAEAKSALASCRASLSFAQNMTDTLLRIIGTSTVKDIDGKADAPAPARSAFAFDEYPNAAAFPPTISITEYWKQRSDHYERLARKACAPAP